MTFLKHPNSHSVFVKKFCRLVIVIKLDVGRELLY